MVAETLELHATELVAASVMRGELVPFLDRWHCGNVPNVVLVFAELLSNAVKYGEAASPVVVCHGDGSVRLDVYDATGRHPRIASTAMPPAGSGSTSWTASAPRGVGSRRFMASGSG